MNDIDTIRFMLTRADGSTVDVSVRKQQDSYEIGDVVMVFRSFLAGCGYLEKTINDELGGPL